MSFFGSWVLDLDLWILFWISFFIDLVFVVSFYLDLEFRISIFGCFCILLLLNIVFCCMVFFLKYWVLDIDLWVWVLDLFCCWMFLFFWILSVGSRSLDLCFFPFQIWLFLIKFIFWDLEFWISIFGSNFWTLFSRFCFLDQCVLRLDFWI